MRDFHSIIVELKKYLPKTNGVKVYDKDVADALEISQANFATIKKRNSIPYKEVLQFCKKNDLCCNEIFFVKVK